MKILPKIIYPDLRTSSRLSNFSRSILLSVLEYMLKIIHTHLESMQNMQRPFLCDRLNN